MGNSPQPAARRVNPLLDPRWDERIARLPGAGFFHSAAWARVLHDTYGFEPHYFVATAHDDETPRACLPLMEVDSWLTGRRGVGLPFTDECAPLAADEASFRTVHAAAVAFARERSWKYVEYRGGRTRLGDAPASTSFYNHRLDLSAGEAQLFAGVDAAVRRAVRKAEKNGLRLTVSTAPAAMEAFYRLQCLTRRRHGLPPQPLAFFHAIQRLVLAPGHGEVVLASVESTPVAGAVYLRFGDTVIYKFGASDERFLHLRANNLVMWDAIRRHARKNLRWFDFGRTSLDNSGLRQFKLGWGATERVVDYARFDLLGNMYVTVPDKVAGWHNHLFRALPVSASRLIGAVLYRHVA